MNITEIEHVVEIIENIKKYKKMIQTYGGKHYQNEQTSIIHEYTNITNYGGGNITNNKFTLFLKGNDLKIIVTVLENQINQWEDELKDMGVELDES